MAMAITLKEFLETEGVHYDLVHHPYSYNTTQAAENSHISGEKIAKAVMLLDDDGYLMAVIPSTHRVQIAKMRKEFHRHFVLAEEADLPRLFTDCMIGAVPPLGKAYDVDVIYDDSLRDHSDVYFEAGDHADLVHVDSRDFVRLMGDARHGQISCHI